MGGAKHHMEQMEHKNSIATIIATEAGVLEACSVHEDIVFQGHEEIEEAYKLGNTKFSSKDAMVSCFATRQEMTDAIKEAAESGDHGNTQCEVCYARIHRDD